MSLLLNSEVLLFSCEAEHLLTNPYCTDRSFFSNFTGCVSVGNSAFTWQGELCKYQ